MSSDFTGHYFCLHIFIDYYYSLVKSRKNNIPLIKFKSIIIAFKIFKAIIFLGIPIKPATRTEELLQDIDFICSPLSIKWTAVCRRPAALQNMTAGPGQCRDGSAWHHRTWHVTRRPLIVPVIIWRTLARTRRLAITSRWFSLAASETQTPSARSPAPSGMSQRAGRVCLSSMIQR